MSQGLHFSSGCIAKITREERLTQQPRDSYLATEKGRAGLLDPTTQVERKGGKSDAQATTGVEQVLRKNHHYEQETKEKKRNRFKSMSDRKEEINTRKGPQEGSGGRRANSLPSEGADLSPS